jgi:transcription elongation factor Elf1
MMKDKEVLKYCAYCKAQTPHQVVDATTNKEGTGGSLVCKKCGSSRLGTIQGFDAALM